jgi:aryl-alcohol dehydrogenase-like predicted oxidoreductase
MESIYIPHLSRNVSRISLGTSATKIAGAASDSDPDLEEKETIATILKAIDEGINVIDTAPIYVHGEAEKTVGKALHLSKKRHDVLIATKTGLELTPDQVVVRNLSKERMREELHRSLKNLKTDYIDIYFIHYPDPLIPMEEVAELMNEFYKSGKIRSIGVSNFTVAQMKAFQKIAPCHFCQPVYNLFERYIEEDILPYCKKHQITLMTYSAIARGLLSGKMGEKREFKKSDFRKEQDPKFQEPVVNEYIEAARRLTQLSQSRYRKSLIELAIRWILDMGVEIAICGARRPDQLGPILGAAEGWQIDAKAKEQIERILQETLLHPPGPPTFLYPQDRSHRKAS